MTRLYSHSNLFTEKFRGPIVSSQ